MVESSTALHEFLIGEVVLCARRMPEIMKFQGDEILTRGGWFAVL